MLLERCTFEDVSAYLRASTGVILPVGSTEQHGPSGLIGTNYFVRRRSRANSAAASRHWWRRL